MGCKWCTLPRDEHRPGLVDHAYQEEVDPSAPEIVVRPGLQADLVLRQALADKGILTPHDLRRAEQKIKRLSEETPNAR